MGPSTGRASSAVRILRNRRTPPDPEGRLRRVPGHNCRLPCARSRSAASPVSASARRRSQKAAYAGPKPSPSATSPQTLRSVRRSIPNLRAVAIRLLVPLRFEAPWCAMRDTSAASSGPSLRRRPGNRLPPCGCRSASASGATVLQVRREERMQAW
ncbi:MAG: hypothetical protein RIT25_2854 [Planctomycetota bacterium]